MNSFNNIEPDAVPQFINLIEALVKETHNKYKVALTKVSDTHNRIEYLGALHALDLFRRDAINMLNQVRSEKTIEESTNIQL